MSYWNRYWYGPVAAIRPYLFTKCFLLMLAFDVLVLMTERGARYGVDGFNVAHFAWLDTIQPIPTATLYVALLMLVSFLAFFLVLTGTNRVLLGVLTVLYTYAWSMSLFDTFQHHYLITIVLTCLLFFPRITARDIIESSSNSMATGSKGKRGRDTQQHQHAVSRGWRYVAIFLIAMLVYRVSLDRAFNLSLIQRWIAMLLFAGVVAVATWHWLRSSCVAPSPLTSAWAYRLLGVTVGVVYFYAALTKCDAEWCGGHTLQKVGSTAIVLQPIEALAGQLGVTRDWFWSVLATCVIPLEITIAGSYFFAIRQDEPARRWTRWWSMFVWLLAVSLHLNNEMMTLILQWFGFYMILVAMIFLLPSSAVMALGTVVLWPGYWVQTNFVSWTRQLPLGSASITLSLATGGAVVILIGVGYYIGVPGALVAFLLLSSLLVLALVVSVVRDSAKEMIGAAIATSVVGIVMAAAVAQCSMRFDYYDLLARIVQQLGDQRAAITYFEKASTFAAPSSSVESDLYLNWGLAHRQLKAYSEALRCYRNALELQPTSFLAHYNLANMYGELQNYEEAIRHYRAATSIKPDFSDAYINLGAVLESKGNIELAIDQYREAIRIEPHAEDVRQHLQVLEKKVQADRAPQP